MGCPTVAQQSNVPLSGGRTPSWMQPRECAGIHVCWASCQQEGNAQNLPAAESWAKSSLTGRGGF
eukprot:scaffold21710_cov36-Cyclotella_meneghiniana.AAC.3